jgi:carboxypeptidase C (cathepsin A)
VFSALFVLTVFSQENKDIITFLPGLKEQPKFKHYAGYLESNSTNKRYLFYWFLESQNNPSSDPVVLWLNGGPGCSSLAGLTTEHGPFMVNADGKTLRVNEYSWNKIANVIYLESPAGVGFSYSQTPDDYDHYDDHITADDSYHFLVNFFKKYPQFAKNEFYISGESFAGHYTIALAYRIHVGNEKKEFAPINLKGILVGNGCTNDEDDANSIPLFLAQHSIIPMSMYNQGLKICKNNFYVHQNDPRCANFLSEAMSKLDLINPYYLYDSCPWTGVELIQSLRTPYKFDKENHPLFNLHRRRISRGAGRAGAEYDAPCVPDSALVQFFNDPDVRKAIHATRSIAAGSWDVCNMRINAGYNWTYHSMLPFYDKLAQYHILVFTGDVDAVVNSLGTQMAIDRLNRTVISDWKPWRINHNGGQLVGGFVRKLSTPDPRGSLTFVTIRGAGHMVGLAKPAENLAMFARQLKGNCC